MSDDFVNLDNARNEHQRSVMKDIKENNHCPFCPEQLDAYHKQPIIRRSKNWIITQNQWPYDFTRVHLLAITTYHAEKIADLKAGAFDELQDHLSWAENEYAVKAGGVAMRFGDVTKSGATVRHLHVHFIVPSEDKPADKKVRFKIS